MSKLKPGDLVTNEYGNTGKLIEITPGTNEAKVAVLNYGIKDDFDWCDIRKCRLANEEELIYAFAVNK